MQRVRNPPPIQPTRLYQESHVYKVFHSAVRRTARQRVGVELFGELLLAGDHPNLRRLDASESQPVPADYRFQRRRYYVTNAGVQVESSEYQFVHASFDGIAGAAVGD